MLCVTRAAAFYLPLVDSNDDNEDDPEAMKEMSPNSITIANAWNTATCRQALSKSTGALNAVTIHTSKPPFTFYRPNMEKR